MVVTVLRKTFQRAQPKVVSYRDYKNFDNELFKSSLQNALNGIKRPDYIKFEEVFLETLNKHAPVKQKTIRGNHAPYMTKGLRKAIMRSIINIGIFSLLGNTKSKKSSVPSSTKRKGKSIIQD